MSTPFPENDIEILDDYVSEAFITSMKKGVSAASIAISNISSDNAELIHQILRDRGELFSFLDQPAFTKCRQRLKEINEQISMRGFQNWQTQLEDLQALVLEIHNLPDAARIGNALRTTPVNFTQKFGRHDGRIIEITGTLPRYSGPLPSTNSGERFMDWVSFLARDLEFDYRIGLLKAEINVGLRSFEEGISFYKGLLRRIPLEDTRRKFIMLRCASAFLAQGDKAFRDIRNPATDTRTEIRTYYEKAIKLVQTGSAVLPPAGHFFGGGAIGIDLGDESGALLGNVDGDLPEGGRPADLSVVVPSPENPLRQQVEKYARMQLNKLEAGFNFIGYRDSYVPIVRPEVLRVLANDRARLADDAIGKFETFKSKADQIQDALKDLNFEEEIKQKTLDQIEKRLANANGQKSIAETRIQQIESSISSLEGIGSGFIGSVLQGTASGFLAGTPKKVVPGQDGGASAVTDTIGFAVGTNMVGVANAASGMVSAIATYHTRQQDLKLLKSIADIEAGIASRDVEIAELDKEIATISLDALASRIRRIKAKELNADLYYAAAEAFRALAERHLDAAIHMAYLYERAVYYRHLETDLQIIRFNYLPLEKTERDPGILLSAAGRLIEHIKLVEANDLPNSKFQTHPEKYRLRLLFPIEFELLRQTGQMEFNFSLYELSKTLPGVFRMRIKRVAVAITGLAGTDADVVGTITHSGSFLLRDRDTTPEPSAGRFLPSQEKLAEAFADLRNGAAQGMAIEGVMPFLLDEDTLVFSKLEVPPHLQPPDLQPPGDVLSIMEGYGPAGRWRLQVKNMKFENIQDVDLYIFYEIPKFDHDLERRMEGLIANFEKDEMAITDSLALITPIRMGIGDLKDALAQLARGETTFAIKTDGPPFPPLISNLKLKTLIVEALDKDLKPVEGINLEILRAGSPFSLKRTTHADGFSEDVTKEIPFLLSNQRIAVEGEYTLRLSHPQQFTQFTDLVLFFVYEFKEIEQ